MYFRFWNPNKEKFLLSDWFHSGATDSELLENHLPFTGIVWNNAGNKDHTEVLESPNNPVHNKLFCKCVFRFSLPTEQNEVPKLPKKPTGKDDEEVSAPTPMLPQLKEPGKMFNDALSNIFQNYAVGFISERTRLIVFGVAKIHKTRLLATLSGLKVCLLYAYKIE